MKKRTITLYTAALAALLIAEPIHADEQLKTKSKRLFEVKNATPIKRAMPKFPKSSARNNQEGWVRFSYVITEEGEVIDPVVIDSSGEKAFETEAIRAIKKWKFEPATQDGKAIQQCEQSVQFDFTLASGSKGVRRRFNSLYKKATEAMVNKELDLASEIADKIKSQKIWNMYENAWFWMLKARIAGIKGDSVEELASLYRANKSDDSKRYLGEKNYSYNLHRMFILELESQKYSRAYDTFLDLKEQENANAYVARLQTYFDRLDALLNSDEPLVQKAMIDERGIMKHELYRNSFAIADISGEVDMLDIRCDNKRSKFTAATDTYWSIPESWGTCSVLFEGDEDTSFSIVEVDEIKKS